jgi:hypothetical protein
MGGTIPPDPLNLTKRRNIRNTPKPAYNCAGYALETFSWYCPHSESPEGLWRNWFLDDEEMEQLTQEATAWMLRDFPGLRVISSLSDLAPTEQAIAFRVSSDCDFHYMRLARNGQWYHKMGNSSVIDRCSTEEALNPNKSWICRYDGPIVLFAKTRWPKGQPHLDV